MAGAIGTRRNPSAVNEGFQMAADRGLRKLGNAAELGDRQLVTVEQQQ